MKLRKVPMLILLALVACTLGVLPGCLSNQPNAVPPAPHASSNVVQPTSKAEVFGTGGAQNRSMSSPTKGGTPLSVPSGGSTKRESEPSAREEDAHQQKLPDQSQESKRQEQAIQDSLNRLATGAFFHNVPRIMRANQSAIIEAGITQQFTEQLRKELEGLGEVVVKQNVRYDPSGVTIQLKASPEEFESRQISGGRQVPIVDAKSTIWKWEVTPLKQGTHYLILTSTVNLYVQREWKYPKEFVIYKEPIDVQVDVGYSLQQFVLNHGLQVAISAIAILFGLFAWWKGLRPQKRGEGLQHPQ